MFIPDPGSEFFQKIQDPHQRIHVFLTQRVVSKLIPDQFFFHPGYWIQG
jgi:hypothetical protein